MQYTLLAAALLALAGIPSAQAGEAQHHHHEHEAAQPAKLMLDAGKRWQTDQPLRDGMLQIRALLAPRIADIHSAKLGAEDYRQLGMAIEKQVEGIVASCKLEPKADAMLHPLIGELLAGAAAMQGKGELQPAAGAHKAVMALNNYGRYFNHPGWQSLR